MTRVILSCLVVTLIGSLTAHWAPAQRSVRPDDYRPRAWCANVIVPQTYRSSAAHSSKIRVTEVAAGVSIVEQAATTVLDVSLRNHTSTQQTAELLIPVPNGAVIRSMTFQGNAKQQKVEILRKEQAKATFDSIVARLKDPALAEFAGYNLIRTSVFPVTARGEQKVRIVYETLLTAEGKRVDYELPRSGSVVYDTPWKVNVRIESKLPVTAVYSPSHPIKTSPVNRKRVTTQLVESASRNPGPFRLSYLLQGGKVSASLFAYPDLHGDGGYFLLLAGLNSDRNLPQSERINRDVSLVIDRSGSMQGQKIEQAKEAALQVIAGLEYGESFNIVAYSDDVESFSDKPVTKTKASEKEAREYINAIVARGGTNLHGALKTSLEPKPSDGHLPIVLFLTDGLPTVGIVAESEIRDVAEKHNPHKRRIFSFGVGYDVNSPLLDKIATLTRGFATFVTPQEDVEAKVARVFRGLDGPTLASPKMEVLNANGKVANGRISDVLPGTIGDLYEGEQLVVLGRYRGKKPLNFRLTGTHGDRTRSFRFSFDLPRKAKVKNSFVARLWASRKIAQLIDSVRDMGAAVDVSTDMGQSQVKELTDEIVRLSKEFGILTEYTSFLAREGVDLSDTESVVKQAQQVLNDRAVICRTGVGSFNQELNNRAQREQAWLNVGNRYLDSNMKEASIATVQQCNVGAYYRRGSRWVSDGNVDNEKELKADRTIQVGSSEYNRLVWKLLAQRRNAELALDGDILITVDGENILVKSEVPKAESEESAQESAQVPGSVQVQNRNGR